MRIKRSNNAAFSLLEVLLASIIFVITVGGLFVTLNAVRLPVAQKENALAAAVYGQQALSYLRFQVNQTSYNQCLNPNQASPPPNGFVCQDFSLFLGTHLVPLAGAVSLAASGVPMPQAVSVYNPNGLSYTVNCADGSTPANCGSDMGRSVSLNLASM